MPKRQRVSRPSKEPVASLNDPPYKERDKHEVGKNAAELLSRESEMRDFFSADPEQAELIKNDINYFFQNELPDEEDSTKRRYWKQWNRAKSFAELVKDLNEDLDRVKREKKKLRSKAISIDSPPNRTPLDMEERNLILQAVKRDPERNFSRIAREFGVSNMTVKRISNAKGIRPGPHSGVKISDEKRAEVLALLPHARSFRAVAAEVGIDSKTVAKIAKESERRSKPRPQSRHLIAG
jgi:hypothetical protein